MEKGAHRRVTASIVAAHMGVAKAGPSARENHVGSWPRAARRSWPTARARGQASIAPMTKDEGPRAATHCKPVKPAPAPTSITDGADGHVCTAEASATRRRTTRRMTPPCVAWPHTHRIVYCETDPFCTSDCREVLADGDAST